MSEKLHGGVGVPRLCHPCNRRDDTERFPEELRKLGIRKISRQTVVRILKEHGLDPDPKRGKGDMGRVHQDPCPDAVGL